MTVGALASPHLVLASGLEALSPAPELVGRFLTRHRNAAVLGAFVRKPNPLERFHKQVAIHDLYPPVVAGSRGRRLLRSA